MSAEELNGKTILLIHAGSMRKKFIFDRLRELGVRIICLNREKTELAVPCVEDWIINDLKDEAGSLQKVIEYIAKHPEKKIAGAVTFWDECILLTSKITDQFGWVGIPSSVSDLIKNKYAFRAACTTQGIAAPCHVLLKTEADLERVNAELEYPVVIKPVYGACSAFVVRANTPAELAAQYKKLKKNIHTFWLAPEWNSLEVLVEEYIVGQEVDIDILLQNGAVQYSSIIDNKETFEPFFVETGWSSPSRLGGAQQEELKKMAFATLAALGVKNGCIHFEAKIGPGGAVPIEVNLRMGGGEVYLYSNLVWGVDLVENAVKICLGIPLSLPPPAAPECCLLSHRFLSTESCRLDSFKVDDALSSQEYFVDLYFEKQIGEVFLAPPAGYDRSIGVITVKGANHDEAAANLVRALGYVHYETNPISKQK